LAGHSPGFRQLGDHLRRFSEHRLRRAELHGDRGWKRSGGRALDRPERSTDPVADGRVDGDAGQRGDRHRLRGSAGPRDHHLPGHHLDLQLPSSRGQRARRRREGRPRFPKPAAVGDRRRRAGHRHGHHQRPRRGGAGPRGARGVVSRDERPEMDRQHQLAERRATVGVVRSDRGARPGHCTGSARQRVERAATCGAGEPGHPAAAGSGVAVGQHGAASRQERAYGTDPSRIGCVDQPPVVGPRHQRAERVHSVCAGAVDQPGTAGLEQQRAYGTDPDRTRPVDQPSGAGARRQRVERQDSTRTRALDEPSIIGSLLQCAARNDPDRIGAVGQP